jgi:hypothetical protein
MLTIRPDRIYRTGVIEAFDRRYDFGPGLMRDMSAFVVGPTVQQRPQRPQRPCAPCACKAPVAVKPASNQLAPTTTATQSVTASLPTLNVRPLVQPRRNVTVSNPAAPTTPAIAKYTAYPASPVAPSIAKATAYPAVPTTPTITATTVR